MELKRSVGPAWSRYNRASRRWRVRASQRSDRDAPSTINRPQIEEQHLILIMLDLRAKATFELDSLSRIQFALEHGELHVAPISAHEFVDATEALIVAYIVGDDEGLTHVSAAASVGTR